MGEKKRVYSARDGVRKTLIYDEGDPNAFTIQTEQNLDEIVAGIARDREMMRHGDSKKLATIPRFIWEDLVERGIADDEDAFKKWLNSYEGAVWRVWRGSV